MLLLGIVTGGLFLGLFVWMTTDKMSPEATAWMKEYHMLVLGGLVALGMAGTAVITGLKRFYLHAALGLIIILGGVQFGVEAPYFVMAWGITAFLIGLWLVMRFLRQYPIAAEDEDYG